MQTRRNKKVLGSTPRSVATEGGRAGVYVPPHPTHFNFRIRKGPIVSVSNIRDISFYG